MNFRFKMRKLRYLCRVECPLAGTVADISQNFCVSNPEYDWHEHYWALGAGLESETLHFGPMISQTEEQINQSASWQSHRPWYKPCDMEYNNIITSLLIPSPSNIEWDNKRKCQASPGYVLLLYTIYSSLMLNFVPVRYLFLDTSSIIYCPDIHVYVVQFHIITESSWILEN